MAYLADEFYSLLDVWISPNLSHWYRNNRNGFRDKFMNLSYEERDRLLVLLSDDDFSCRDYFQCALLDYPSVDWIFKVLRSTAKFAVRDPDARFWSEYRRSLDMSSNMNRSNSLPNYVTRIQSHSQRPVASLINPFRHEAGATIFDGESTSGHRNILAEARATGDDEADYNLKFFGPLATGLLTMGYEASVILRSINNNPLPLSIGIYGYLNVACVTVGVFACLGGLSLCTLKPDTLSFGCNPRDLIRILHFVVLHCTGYAFIGMLCLMFLQDKPFMMWIIACLVSIVFMALMIFIGNGKRR